MNLFYYFGIFGFCFALSINGQEDKSFCDIDAIQADPLNLPLPQNDPFGAFSAIIERNSGDKPGTEEIREYFDGTKKIGISSTEFSGGNTKLYADFQTNELLAVINGNCFTKKLNESDDTTNFHVVTIGGKQILLSPLSFLIFEFNEKIKFIGSNNKIRNVPVNQWVSCLYEEKTKTTMKITLSFSNPEKWAPAAANTTLIFSEPMQILIEKKRDGAIFNDTYNVFEFKPSFPSAEEFYYTPAGVYCKDRENKKDLPFIPTNFQFRIQKVFPLEDHNLLGLLSDTMEEYDLDSKLFHLVTDEGDHKISEFHDFSTGTLYTINQKTGNCSIKRMELGSNGIDSIDFNNLVTIRDPKQFFDFDNVPYQYTGQRIINGVNTNVWIGPKFFQGQDTTFEWYFLADEWSRTDILDSQYVTPIQLIITFITQKFPQKITKSVTNHFFNYRQSKITVDHDLTQCGNHKSSKDFTFSFNFEKNPEVLTIVKKNRLEFESKLLQKIKEISKVTLLRISNLELAFSEKSIFVLITLFERVDRYGAVEIPQYDALLKDAANNLKNAVKKGDMDFVFFLFQAGSSSQTHQIYTNKDSFAEIEDRQEGFIQLNQFTAKKGYSSGIVAFITIVITLVGILLSLALLTLHKNKKITLPLISKLI